LVGRVARGVNYPQLFITQRNDVPVFNGTNLPFRYGQNGAVYIFKSLTPGLPGPLNEPLGVYQVSGASLMNKDL